MSAFNFALYVDRMNMAHMVEGDNMPIKVPTAPCQVDKCTGASADMRYIPRVLYRPLRDVKRGAE